MSTEHRCPNCEKLLTRPGYCQGCKAEGQDWLLPYVAQVNATEAKAKMADQFAEVLECLIKTVGHYSPQFPMSPGMFAMFREDMNQAEKLIAQWKAIKP